jgi:threonine/homoserine/homoserine lactone efflux protein
MTTHAPAPLKHSSPVSVDTGALGSSAQHVTLTGVVTLGLIETLTALIYMVGLAFATARAIVWLRRPRITQALDRISAVVLAAFGIGTLASATT